jgi:hypothetical protein
MYCYYCCYQYHPQYTIIGCSATARGKRFNYQIALLLLLLSARREAHSNIKLRNCMCLLQYRVNSAVCYLVSAAVHYATSAAAALY